MTPKGRQCNKEEYIIRHVQRILNIISSHFFIKLPLFRIIQTKLHFHTYTIDFANLTSYLRLAIISKFYVNSDIHIMYIFVINISICRKHPLLGNSRHRKPVYIVLNTEIDNKACSGPVYFTRVYKIDTYMVLGR